MADLRKQVEGLLVLCKSMPPVPWEASQHVMDGGYTFTEFGSIEPDIPVGEMDQEQQDVGDSLCAVMSAFPAVARHYLALLDENAKLRDTEERAIKYAAWLEEQKERLAEACQTFTQGLGSEDGYFPSLGEPATRKALDLMRRAGVEPIGRTR